MKKPLAEARRMRVGDYAKGDGLIADLRGTFGPTTSSTLLLEDNGNHAPVRSWEAGAAISYEF